MGISGVLDTLETTEEQLKRLLEETPDTICIGPKNNRDLISDALEAVQFASRCILRLEK